MTANTFDLHGAGHVARVLRNLSNQPQLHALEKLLLDAADDIERRHSNDRPYANLRVALRNAIFRESKNDVRLDPSPVFRLIERPDFSQLEATDLLAQLLGIYGDKRWLDGVECTAKSMSAKLAGAMSEAG